MSNEPENKNMEPQNVPGWTFVNSQGEVMSGDEDSESSESSIEVINIENDIVVSHRLQRERIPEPVDAVVREDLTSAYTPTKDTVNLEDVTGAVEYVLNIDSGEGNQKSIDLEEAIQDSDLNGIEAESNLQTELPRSDSSSHQNDLLDNINYVSQEIDEGGPGGYATAHCDAEADSVFSHEVPTASCEFEIDPSPEKTVQETSTSDYKLQFASDHSNVLLIATENLQQISLGIEPENSAEVEATITDGNASTTKLLFEGDETTLSETMGTNDQQIPVPVSSEEAKISQVSDEGATGTTQSSRSDSDADSDFVRLDSENLYGYDGQLQNNEERVVIPLRLFRAGSSIGPSFNFMNDERNFDTSQSEESAEVIDQDRDDDTESSTEEGIDDRIESEQSEAGSLSAQNDVGDLSVFADIGDLPLIAGDVPRNYIHRPNNHLSTVLNIIVVLVAILTMGISLGIIMATDLEIEEWQNAHEFQSRRVNQLEILLKSKTNAYEVQLNRVKELEPQLIEIRNNVRILEKRAKNYERAFETLAAHSAQEGETVKKVLHTLLDGVRVYVQCQEESSQLLAVDCHLKLLPYLRNYTTLINNDLSARRTIHDDSLFNSSTDNDIDVKVSSPNINVDTSTRPVSGTNDVSGSDSHNEEQLIHSNDAFDKDKEQNQLVLEVDSDAAPTQRSNIEQASFKSNDNKNYQTPVSHSRPKQEQIKAKETIQALPIAMDIRQLQQFLTREQERALHWQQLYLSERRQRERERENEELEDEREREMAERAREQMDHVECLRKLMSANLTTLTKHVVKWNVSVFDDFANLSVLLSGISELQQAVVDSVQKVWKSAEEVIDSLHSSDSGQEKFTEKYGVPKKEVIIDYLSHVADQIKRVDMLNHETLIEYFGKMLDHVKDGVDDILHEIYDKSVSDSAYKMLQNAEILMKGLSNYKQTTIDGENNDNPWPNKEQFLAYLSKMIDDICPKDELASKLHSIKHPKVNANDNESLDVNHLKSNPNKCKVTTGELPTGPDSEFVSNPHLNDEKTDQDGFWSRKIGKMFKKTGKTVRKLGRKVAGTWDKIKTIWNKPLWHKLKNIWRKKKDVFVTAGDNFASNVRKASSKFANKCKKLYTNWFKAIDTIAVNIKSKCVQILRQYWQKMVLKDPCHMVGKFSFECNSRKWQHKKDLNIINDQFSDLMNIPNMKHDQIYKLNITDMEVYHSKFKSFKKKWGDRKLLLKTDITWVKCQLSWWSLAISASKHENLDELKENKCDTINITDNFYNGQHKNIFNPDFSCYDKKAKKENDYMNDDNFDNQPSEIKISNNLDEVEEVEVSLKNEDDLKDEAETNETLLEQEDSLNKNHKHIHHNNIKKNNEEDVWVFKQAKFREQIRNREQDNNDKIHLNNWYLEKAKERETLRTESDKISVRFEYRNHRKPKHHKKDAKKFDDWFMKQAEEREQIRKNEHKSDWLFDRAADRKKDRENKYKLDFRKYDSRKPEQYRHVYGKVLSTP